VDRAQRACHQQPHQQLRVTLVGLDPIGRRPRRLTRRDHIPPHAPPSRDQLLELLLRFKNVVLWLNGHIHANRITPHASPQSGHGLWEVTTSSLVDWPCQGRLVELFDAGEDTLAIACTMLDHEGAVRSGDGGLDDLAGWHRELAANMPHNGFESWRPGKPADRNATLLLRRPF